MIYPTRSFAAAPLYCFSHRVPPNAENSRDQSALLTALKEEWT